MKRADKNIQKAKVTFKAVPMSQWHVKAIKAFILMTVACLLVISFKAHSSETIATITYTEGIDEGTNTLLPDSDWTLEVTSTWGMTCDDISPDLEFYKSKLVPVTSYINRDLDCNLATHPGFEDEDYIVWDDAGYHQMPEFGLENITCPIYGQCEMQRVVNTERKYFDAIELENGEPGTLNGAGKVFVTKLNSVSIQAEPGKGGVGGKNDLKMVEAEKRYCAKIQDATTIDATVESSKTPYATVHVYDWMPFEISAGGANGTDAPAGRKVEVYKGLSPAALYRLKKQYMN